MVVPTSHNPSTPTSAPGNYVESWEPYAQLALAQLKLELYESGDGLMVVQEPEESLQVPPTVTVPPQPVEAPRRRWSGGLKKLLRRRKETEDFSIECEASNPAELLAWLFARLAKEQQLGVLVPVGDPRTVHELTDRLFSAYDIEGGSLHLGGCHLENVPFLRLTRGVAQGEANQAGELQVAHAFFDAAGKPVESSLVAKLKLNEVDLPVDSPPIAKRTDWSAAITAGEQTLPGAKSSDEMAAAIVYIKRATGQLEVTIGDESLAVGFEGWTRTLKASPAICPLTGVRTFQLTALSDGRIAAASEVVRCESSGETVLHRDCVRCSVTDQTVKEDLCNPCPVSGDPSLPEGFATCPRCGQQVSRVVLTKHGCKGCDHLTPVAKDDERVTKLIAAAPKLAEQKKLRVAETDTALIAQFGGLLSETIVVVDKASGQVCHAARRGRLSSTWSALGNSERAALLGSN